MDIHMTQKQKQQPTDKNLESRLSTIATRLEWQQVATGRLLRLGRGLYRRELAVVAQRVLNDREPDEDRAARRLGEWLHDSGVALEGELRGTLLATDQQRQRRLLAIVRTVRRG